MMWSATHKAEDTGCRCRNAIRMRASNAPKGDHVSFDVPRRLRKA